MSTSFDGESGGKERRGGGNRGGSRGGGGGGNAGGRRRSPSSSSTSSSNPSSSFSGFVSLPPPSEAAVSALTASAAEHNIPVVVLKGGRSKIFRGGAPVVYGGAVDAVVARPPPARGAVVAVADGDRRAFGWGFYNPESPLFRVRVMALAGQEQQKSEEREGEEEVSSSSPFDVGALVRRRVAVAAALRRSLGLPRPGVTTAYRLVNSEGDRLSGLVVDALGGSSGEESGEEGGEEGGKEEGGSLVVASSAAWCEEHRAEIEGALLAETGGRMGIVWTRSAAMMREEGVVVPGEDGEEGEEDGEEAEEADVAAAPPPSTSSADSSSESEKKTVVLENGLKFLVTPGRGQKTGFYADQRESRLFVRQLVENATRRASRDEKSGDEKKLFRVLDLCCFHGGFALSAAKGGATHVVGVDSSVPALEVARENARLNGFADEDRVVRFERGDAGDFLARAARAARDDAEAGVSSSSSDNFFDLVVLDPPKLAPTRASLPAALRRYQSLNTAAMRLLLANAKENGGNGGGLLMTCSCSGAVAAAGAFEPMLAAAAARAGARISVLRVAGAAPCHAIDPSYLEGKYLTNVLLRVTRA